jgi:hypothetical protein
METDARMKIMARIPGESKFGTRHGQAVLEYGVLLMVLCLVFVTMSVYAKNGVRSKLYVVQERLNEARVTNSMPQ